MLCILMLVETLTVPVCVADTDEELSGLTSSHGLAFKRRGEHSAGSATGSLNCAKT
jgi:hypothetical protein